MKTKIILLLVTIQLILSCKSKTTDSYATVVEELADVSAEMSPPSPPPAAEQEIRYKAPEVTDNINTSPSVSRKIIKDASMEIKVKELEQSKKEIDTLIKKYQGYYSNENFNNAELSRGFNLTIRVPSDNFDSFISEIEMGSGELVYKNVSSRDVTEEFIDLETRLKNKRNYLNRYNDLLKQAKTVKDLLEIQENTRVIEEELESTMGRLKYLNNQIDYSTLTLQISKKNDFNKFSNRNGKFIDRLKLSLVKGWFGFVSFGLFLIRIWPLWIILGLLYYIFKKIKFKKRK